jgi:hypothetical protein
MQVEPGDEPVQDFPRSEITAPSTAGTEHPAAERALVGFQANPYGSPRCDGVPGRRARP